MADDTQSAGSNADLDPYYDAAERLEGTIETQISIINGIDDKAEYTTRIIGVILGLIVSVLSIGTNLNAVEIGMPSLPVKLCFTFGIGWLIAAMAAAIITYLSSWFRIGLDSSVGYHLGHPTTKTESEEHIRRVLTTYAEILEENAIVIETNSKRFRYTLTFLLQGILYLSAAGLLYAFDPGAAIEWIGTAVTLGIGAGFGWYILSGRYLTLEEQR